jgi:hypothetical protein
MDDDLYEKDLKIEEINLEPWGEIYRKTGNFKCGSDQPNLSSLSVLADNFVCLSVLGRTNEIKTNSSYVLTSFRAQYYVYLTFKICG